MEDLKPKEKAITVAIRSVYGNERIYPVCDASKLFAELSRKKTLDRQDIQIIRSLGYRVAVASEEI